MTNYGIDFSIFALYFCFNNKLDDNCLVLKYSKIILKNIERFTDNE